MKKQKTVKNLKPRAIKLLREVQRFLISEPRRFNMKYGIVPASTCPASLLEQPPCNTACCIAGAAYFIHTNKPVTTEEHTIGWNEIIRSLKSSGLTEENNSSLFFLGREQGGTRAYWPDFFEQAYYRATTPLQRACIGVARIEHYIATDGRD